MTLYVITMVEDASRYVEAARHAPTEDPGTLWDRHVIAPTWHLWGAGQFNAERVRAHVSRPILDLDALEADLALLEQVAFEPLLQEAYVRATSLLPSPEPDRTVCVAPLASESTFVREQMHGVVGQCVGDNILLEVGVEPGWEQALLYHLAHEYHHSVWGYTYYYLQGHRDAPLLNSIVNEGEADTFAHLCCPGVDVPWVNALAPAQEREQWCRMQPLLDSEDPSLYSRFMFGEPASDTPPFSGYTVGFHMVQRYLGRHLGEPVPEWTARPPHEIMADSGYTGEP